MIVILTAIVFAIPIGYYVLNMLFVSVYPYHTAIGPIPFLTAAVILTAVTFLTIGSRIYRAAHANPVESLHYE
jgi:ABC-type antimicrobial peptide transport system permease subunit